MKRNAQFEAETELLLGESVKILKQLKVERQGRQMKTDVRTNIVGESKTYSAASRTAENDCWIHLPSKSVRVAALQLGQIPTSTL